LNRLQTPAPPHPKQPVREEEQQKPHKGGQKMEKIEIAHGEVNPNRPSESSRTHYGYNLRQTPVQLGEPSHKQQKTSDGTQATAKSCPIMRDEGD
jgi:hypothetical protein